VTVLTDDIGAAYIAARVDVQQCTASESCHFSVQQLCCTTGPVACLACFPTTCVHPTAVSKQYIISTRARPYLVPALTAAVMLQPVVPCVHTRSFISWIGSLPATKHNFKKLLKHGSVAVVVGGIAEMVGRWCSCGPKTSLGIAVLVTVAYTAACAHLGC
jgi:hypothetical protein